tara:strand:- start:53278 stop:54528 length:1251 start_codon:yes stop_codon:yes gene_type:complete
MEAGVRRITDTWLYDGFSTISGDFLLHEDGSWEESKGDEDVSEVVDGKDRFFTRSLQNWHTHLPMTLNRGMGEGLDLMSWLKTSIFPTEEKVTRDLVRIGASAAVSELIATGTTFACDMYHFPESIGPILDESGIRGIVCGPTTTWPPNDGGSEDLTTLRRLEELLSDGPLGNGRVEYGVATHAVYTCSEEVLMRGSDLARRHDSTLHIHTSETREEVVNCHEEKGMYPIEYLDSIGYFTDRTVCAHCGWVTKKEMGILASHSTTCVHCPTSNQKLACGGTMSYPAMKEAGVDVRLGTDGAASNNSLDLRREAKAASMIQRHDHWDATILDPEETWMLATKGSKDWVSWDLSDIRMRPIGKDGRRLLANLLYSDAKCMDVFVDGKSIRRNGVTLTLNEKEIGRQLEDSAVEYYRDI